MTPLLLFFFGWWVHAAPMAHPSPTPSMPPLPTPTPEPDSPPPNDDSLFAVPPAPQLSSKGEDLVIEFEVGGKSGYNPHPELPDLRMSGVTVGIGYDLHQVSKAVILSDWTLLSPPTPARLAATQPFYGQSAIAPWKAVRDIIVAWAPALNVFNTIDVARTWKQCQRGFPGFDELRPNAQAALVSLVFNRGTATNGPSRTEMRAIHDLVPKQDYAGMASQLRRMIRVWRGTSIERGMTRRRYAEAQLMETP